MKRFLLALYLLLPLSLMAGNPSYQEMTNYVQSVAFKSNTVAPGVFSINGKTNKIIFAAANSSVIVTTLEANIFISAPGRGGGPTNGQTAAQVYGQMQSFGGTNFISSTATNVMALSVSESSPLLPPPLWVGTGWGNSTTVNGDTSFVEVTNIACDMIGSGKWASGYRTIEIDSGWATNIDANGHFICPSNVWPGGMSYCVNWLQTNWPGKPIGTILWCGGIEPQMSYMTSCIGDFNAQSILDELSWGVVGFKVQAFFNPSHSQKDAPDSNLGPGGTGSALNWYAQYIPTMRSQRPVWLFNAADKIVTNGVVYTYIDPLAWGQYNLICPLAKDGIDQTHYEAAMSMMCMNSNAFAMTRPGLTINGYDGPEFIRQVWFNGGGGTGGGEVRSDMARQAIRGGMNITTSTTSTSALYNLAYTNADLIRVSQDPACNPPIPVEGTADLTVGPTNIQVWYAWKRTLSDGSVAVAVLSLDTNITMLSQLSQSVIQFTNYVLNLTNYGFAASQPVTVKGCFYPHYGNWGRGYYGESEWQKIGTNTWQDSYTVASDAYTNNITPFGADFLILSTNPPPVPTAITLNILAPWNVTNDSPAINIILSVNPKTIHTPSGQTISNSVTQRGNSRADWYIPPGAANFTYYVCVNDNYNNDHTICVTNIVLTNGVEAWRTNLAYNSPAITNSISMIGVTNLSLLTLGTNANPIFITDAQQAIWGEPLVTW